MIIVIWRGQLKADSQKAYDQLFEEKMAPLLKQTAGFRKHYTGFDAQANKAVIVAVWESGKASQTLLDNPEWQKVYKELAQYHEGELEREVYKVTVEI